MIRSRSHESVSSYRSGPGHLFAQGDKIDKEKYFHNPNLDFL